MVRYYTRSQLESIVGRNEQVLWRGKPNKQCFILESIFNPLLPFAIIWLIFDSFFIFAFTSGAKGAEGLLTFFVPFMLLHLMPVWIYIGGVLLTFLKYKNTEYLITDKSIYVSGGAINYKETSISYSKISDIQMRRGIFDKKLGVGDVLINPMCRPADAAVVTVNGRVQRYDGYDITDIPDFREVYDLILTNMEKIEKPQENYSEEPVKEELSDRISSFMDLYKKK